MTYGRAKRTTRMRTSRITRVTATQKTARAAKLRAARAKPKAVRGNARGIAANARAIGALKKQLYGPVQKQITSFSQMVTATKMHPLIFQVNNLGLVLETLVY